MDVDTILNTYAPRIILINNDACIKLNSNDIDENTSNFVDSHEKEILKAIKLKENFQEEYETTEVSKKINKTNVSRKVGFPKAGSDAANCRINIPKAWLEQLGVLENEAHINLELDNDKIIIKKIH